ncbi:MAG: right-handed parallel beta-helix repeat-containing protein [Firmicutes bacterium]|nr:right-handed parallel beta-helix repeat-containing protein [Bacillota bacterium]
MNRQQYYFDQDVVEQDLSDLQTNIETADQNIVKDFLSTGILYGLDLISNTPANLTVLVTAPAPGGIAYTKDGQRIYVPTQQVVDCSAQLPATAGNERWITIVARFIRAYSDPRKDGYGTSVLYKADESFALSSLAGAEAATGAATKPAIPTDGSILLGDIKLPYGTTQITSALIDRSRRAWLSKTIMRIRNAADYTSIQAAVEDLRSTGNGGVVYVPAGVWNEQVVLYSNMTLMGAGRGATIIQNPSTSGGNGIEFGNWAENVTIRDLEIEGNPQSGNGIFINTAQHWLIMNVRSDLNGGAGLKCQFGLKGVISDSYFGQNNIGIHMVKNPTAEEYSNANVVNGCMIRMNQTGVKIEGGDGLRLKGCTVEGNTTYGVVVLTRAQHGTIEDTWFEANGQKHVWITGQANWQIKGCCFYTTNPMTVDVDLDSCRNIKIKDCQFGFSSPNLDIDVASTHTRVLRNEFYGNPVDITDASATTVYEGNYRSRLTASGQQWGRLIWPLGIDLVGSDLLNVDKMTGKAFLPQGFGNILKNGDLSSWSGLDTESPDGWIAQNANVQKDTTVKDRGAYSCKVQQNLNFNWAGLAQRHDEWLSWAKFIGKVTFIVRAMAPATNTLGKTYIQVGHGGSGALQMAQIPADGVWHTIVLTATIPSDAILLFFYIYSNTDGAISGTDVVYIDSAWAVLGELPVAYLPNPANELVTGVDYQDAAGTNYTYGLITKQFGIATIADTTSTKTVTLPKKFKKLLGIQITPINVAEVIRATNYVAASGTFDAVRAGTAGANQFYWEAVGIL